jgi:hypothetical protein
MPMRKMIATGLAGIDKLRQSVVSECTESVLYGDPAVEEENLIQICREIQMARGNW